MLRLLLSVVVCGLACCGNFAAAQPPENSAGTKEHEWLQQFVGEWKTASEASMGPDQPEMKCTGSMNCRMLGKFWIVNEMKADIMGSTMNGVQTIGYDSSSKKYVGTWVDNMMDHMWRYEGSVDESGKTLTLEAEGPNFMAAGKMTKFRDAYEFKSADHIVATSSMLTEDGKWVVFMTGQVIRNPNAEAAAKAN
ncbi:MAG: DUF1579 domain-containing protein [Fuerstiella sp.]